MSSNASQHPALYQNSQPPYLHPSGGSRIVRAYPNPANNEDLLQPLKLTLVRKIAIASGHLLNDLVAGLWFSYFILFMQYVVRLSPVYAGYLMLLGQVADAIATPLIGLEASKGLFLCPAYGRCKSWHLLGVVIVTFTTPFVFIKCIACDEIDDYAKMIYYAPFVSLSQIGWAAVQISHLALIPKMSPDELVRTEIIAYRYAFTVAANVTVFILAYFSLGLIDKFSPADGWKFSQTAIISMSIGAAASIIFHFSVPEQADTAVKRSIAFLNSLPAFDHRRKSISESLQCSTNTGGYHPYSRRRSTLGKYSQEARQALLGSNVNVVQQPSTVTIPEPSEVDVSFHLESGRHYDSMPSTSPHGLGGSIHHHSQTVLSHLQHSLHVINRSVQTLRPTNPLSTTWLSLGKDRMRVGDWFKMYNFYMVGIIYMATRLSVNVTQVYVPLYLKNTLHLPTLTLSTIPLTMYMAGLFVSCFIKAMNKYVGRQLSFIFGAILSINGALIVYCCDWEADPFMKDYGIYGVAALLGGGGSAMLVTSLSITADLIGSNVESGAFVYGALSFTDKLSCGLVISLISYAVPCEDNTDTPSAECITSLVPFYRICIALVAGGTAILGVIAVVLLTVQIYVQSRSLRKV